LTESVLSASFLAIVAHDPEIGSRVLSFLARQHPIAVHFPIGLVLTAAFLELLICLHRRDDWLAAQRFCLRFGALTGAVAAGLGWFLAAQFKEGQAMELHRWLGVAATAAMLIAAFLVPRWPESERRGFRWMLTLAAMLIALAGHFGGYLVHGAAQFRV
jgi:uncharacterized membrane protein